MRMTKRQHSGFTLIELITVIVLIGALAVIGGLFIVQPFQAAEDMQRRAELVDEAQLIIERMSREIRTALPNSIRTAAGGSRLEFVTTRTGGRYRRLPAAGGGGDPLNRTQSSDTFDVLGGLPEIDNIATGGGGIDCASGGADCISIYNTGQANFDVYNNDNIAEITATPGAGTADPTDDQITYANDGNMPAFRQHSPRQRFFVIDGVVSYICDGGGMNRHADYGLNQDPTNEPARLMARDVTNCNFTYSPGTSMRSGLATIRITISRDGESVSLFHQVHVMNAP